MSLKNSILKEILKGRFSLLLFSIVFMFLVLPLVPVEQVFLDQSVGIFGLIILLSCLRVITKNRGFFIFMVVLSLVNLVIGSTELLSQTNSDSFKTWGLAFRLIYYLLVFISIMSHVLDQSPVTSDKIAGSISAYILLGIVWSVVYTLFQHLQPGSFVIPEHLQTDSTTGIWAVYFSFTTLTTLGYGDITPHLPAAQTYAIMEAACGQIFLTVLVARLVALQIIHSRT